MLKTKGVKLKPILNAKSTKLLNLTVLQRLDPCVLEIIATAAHVVVYGLNTDTIEWNRKNVQGSLFVVKRNTQPRFQFIVMNRLNTENLVESLLGDFEYEVQGPYLLYRIHSEEINGIWFYHANECGEVANLFGRILNAYPKVPLKSKEAPVKSEVEKDAPQEPSPTVISNVEDVADDPSFVNISSPCQSSTALVSAPPQSITLETLLPAPAPASSSSAPLLSIPENPECKGANCTTDLVKPSSFLSPGPPSRQIMTPLLTSSVPTASPLISPGNLKRPYGELFLLPFPPPSSPQSITPTSVPTPTYVPVISREQIRKALQLLIQVRALMLFSLFPCTVDFLAMISEAPQHLNSSIISFIWYHLMYIYPVVKVLHTFLVQQSCANNHLRACSFCSVFHKAIDIHQLALLPWYLLMYLDMPTLLLAYFLFRHWIPIKPSSVKESA